jgi:pyruvate/2-oxoglutarate dehydrogenase complex dihydrolipoamide dehydrogenase (E3) component
MDSRPYDAIVIGTGQGGGPLSTALAGAGMRTAIVERSYVGGTCINYGCTPTKTMVASARVAYKTDRSARGSRSTELSTSLAPAQPPWA